MTLYQELQSVTSEEDVKDAYIKALGLKKYQKNLIDIQTKEVWFESKDSSKNSTYAMFTQLLHYVQVALNKGEYIPPFLVVMDTKKAAIMKSSDIIPFLAKKTIKWGTSASNYTQEALNAVSSYIGTYFVSFNIETHETEFISTVKNAIASGEIIRTQITPDNLKQVFDKWVLMIGREIENINEENYALLFYADIMSDGNISTHANLPAELLHKNNDPVFCLGGKNYELNNKEGYRRFWAIYDRPPKKEYRDYLLERRDSLIPLDERGFKGAYYTPLSVVDKAYDKLTDLLGNNWQKNYIVWDMCCGVGNLEVKHSNPRNLFMSTLDKEDVDVMKATKTCVSAIRFQYDYLNDDISDDGQIDYNLTNKVPQALRDAIKSGKKILVLINPPYAEATNGANTSIASRGDKTSTKEGVSKTKFGETGMKLYGKASNELFTQFVARIAQEIPNATLAMFSKLKYITAPTLEEFRNNWNAKYMGGFVVDSRSFDGLKGTFPIGFLVWKTNTNSKRTESILEIRAEVLDKNVQPIGEKIFYAAPTNKLLSNWVKRPKTNDTKVIPLKNAIVPATATKDLRGTKWSEDAIAYFFCGGNDFQTAQQQTAIFSSGYSSARGFYVNKDNLWQAAVIFTVRRIIKQTWLNDRDQFLQPSTSLSKEFISDCIIWTLFNSNNLTAGAKELKWNNETWDITNHFIPFTEEEVGAPDRFESDFMVQYLSDWKLSKNALSVFNEGKHVWKEYFNHVDSRSVRDELKLNRTDVGWYQIRQAIKIRNAGGDFPPFSFEPFDKAYKELTDKIQPLVLEYGFIKN